MIGRIRTSLIGLATFYLALFNPLQAQFSAPDAFGYTWTTSDSAGGPAFAWLDLPNTPGAMQLSGLEDENSIGPIALGFDFRYFWRDQDAITIGSNGWLSFDYTPIIASCFDGIPTAGNSPNNILAPFMADLNFTSSYVTFPNIGELWFWTNQVDSAVISYEKVPFWKEDQSGMAAPDWVGANTFQVILDASDSSITYQYLRADDSAFINRAICPRELIIGYEGPTGKIGDEMAREVLPPDSSVIRIVAPTQDTFQITDATVRWGQNPRSQAEFVLAGAPLEVASSFGNLGNATIDSGAVVTHRLFDPDFNFIWFTQDTLDSIPAGAAIKVPTTYTGGYAQTGGYFLQTRIQSADDVDTKNNLVFTEVNVVPDTGTTVKLSYASRDNTNDFLGWPPGIGDLGLGIFMDYPYHDMQVRAVEVFIGGDNDPSTPVQDGFRIDLRGADPGTGAPGPVLASQLVTPASVLEEQWNRIEFDPPVGVDSGRVYVGWIQGGNSIGLGRETSAPISRRSFEIINGVWGPYRDNNSEEFLVRVEIERALVGVEKSRELPWSMAMGPNPGGGRLELRWEQRRAGAMKMEVYDLQGRRRGFYKWGVRGPGSYAERISTELSPGVYQVVFSNEWGRSVKKWVVKD